MQTLSGLGFTGYYETVTPGSGSRPDYLAQEEQNNLNDQSTTGVGAVWNLYYAQLLEQGQRHRLHLLRRRPVRRQRLLPGLRRVAVPDEQHDGLLVRHPLDQPDRGRQQSAGRRGEPRYGLPASLDSFYTNTSSTGMMASAIRMALSCNFKVFYWAHDIHLWDGTLPFSLYAASIAPGATPSPSATPSASPSATPTASATANLALTGTVTASNTVSGFPASAANDGNQNTYWQATGSTATLTLHLAQAAPIARIILELPSNWGTRTQTVQMSGRSGSGCPELEGSSRMIFATGAAWARCRVRVALLLGTCRDRIIGCRPWYCWPGSLTGCYWP